MLTWCDLKKNQVAVELFIYPCKGTWWPCVGQIVSCSAIYNSAPRTVTEASRSSTWPLTIVLGLLIRTHGLTNRDYRWFAFKCDSRKNTFPFLHLLRSPQCCIWIRKTCSGSLFKPSSRSAVFSSSASAGEQQGFCCLDTFGTAKLIVWKWIAASLIKVASPSVDIVDILQREVGGVKCQAY